MVEKSQMKDEYVYLKKKNKSGWNGVVKKSWNKVRLMWYRVGIKYV